MFDNVKNNLVNSIIKFVNFVMNFVAINTYYKEIIFLTSLTIKLYKVKKENGMTLLDNYTSITCLIFA